MPALRSLRTACLALALGAFGCAAPPPRGLVLVSIDTLRADHLGAYGYERATSPFFDELASRGALFENVIVQLPGTLPSHMSMFTGLYPAEHGVYPPDRVLAAEIRTVPERLRAAGVRTAGFTEGGYVAGRYGFARGFERFADEVPPGPRAVETTFARGVEFLSGLEPGERFVLFLHTSAVHDPYDPPAPYRDLFWSGPPPAGAFEPTGPNLTEVNRGTRSIDAETVRYFEALYDGGIRYVDDQLKVLFGRLEELDLLDETTIVVTSDHGEEFLEHGKLVHQQIYRENVRVPLLVLQPGGRPARVPALVEGVDVAPSLLELAGVAGGEPVSGRSFTHLLRRPQGSHRAEAYSEQFGSPVRGLHRVGEDGDLWHLVRFSVPAEGDGHWVEREVSFDVETARFELAVHTYREPRTLAIRLDGAAYGFFDLAVDKLHRRSLALPGGLHRVTLAVPTCTVPADLGTSRDRRCLGFRLLAGDLAWSDLFALGADPAERSSVADRHAALAAELGRRLDGYRWQPRASAGQSELEPELREQLEALGYL